MSRWQQLDDKFSSLTMREKWLVLFAGAAVIFAMIDNLLLTPKKDVLAASTKQIQSFSRENMTISNTIAELQNRIANNPNTVLESQIKQFKHQISLVDNDLLAFTSELIDPIEMRLALQDLLQKQSGVKIKAMHSLSPSLVQFEEANENEPVDSNKSDPDGLLLYQHGIELTLSGRYFELRNYLKLIEELPWKFIWQSLDFEAKTYPEIEIKVTLYSLSRQKEFIGV